MDLGLLQRHVAQRLGVTPSTVTYWELGHKEPRIHTLGGIIDFLGYVPFEIGETLPQKLIAYRAIRGLTQEAVAAEKGIDETTWRQWEAGIIRPRFARSLAIIEDVERFLADAKGDGHQPASRTGSTIGEALHD